MYLFKLEFSPDLCPGMGSLGHMGVLVLVFKGNSLLFSIVAARIYIPINSIGEFPFLHALTNTYYLQGC